MNRLLTASEKTAAFTAPPSCPDSGSVWCRQYGYDTPGNRTIAGRWPSGSESWDVSSISSATNKILDAGWSYDAAGNVIGDSNTGNTFSVLYDAESRQVAYCFSYNPNCTNTPGTGVTVYYYDGEGRRVEQVESTTTTVFVYDAFGELVADYGALPAAPASATEYVTVDDVGTTRLVTDSQGNVLERHDFEPFGHEILGAEGGAWRPGVAGYYVSPTSVRQQFTGQERDDTGLDFFQARYFSSAQGRFASVDPGNAGASLGDPQSWNGYAYVGNSPLRFTDPSGEGFWGDVGLFLGAAIGSFIPGANIAFDALFGFVVGNVVDVERGGLSALSPIPGMGSSAGVPPGAQTTGGLPGVIWGNQNPFVFDDIWISSDGIHQNINVGNPNGPLIPFTFALAIWTDPFGNVKKGQFGGMVMYGSETGIFGRKMKVTNQYIHTTSEQDKKVLNMLKPLVGKPGWYLPTNNCRTWSQEQFENVLKELHIDLVHELGGDHYCHRQ